MFDKILETISKASTPLKAPERVLFNDLMAVKEDLHLLSALGNKVLSFLKDVDLTHPEVVDIYDRQVNNEKFVKTIIQSVAVLKFCKTNNYSIIDNIVTNNQPLTYLDSPLNNRKYIRILKNREDRDAVRKLKETHDIPLSSGKKGHDAWNSVGESFSSYIRFNDQYKEEIESAKEKAKRYKELNCLDLEKEIINSLDKFTIQANDKYLGFHRITIPNAAIILAKLHGFSITTDAEIRIHNEKFGFKNGSYSPLYHPYCARAYSIFDMLDVVPDNIKKIIDVLENHPDSCGKPIFDHYIVVVPSVTSWTKETIDKKLISDKIIVPVLLGERGDHNTSKCYFISNFI